MWQRSKNGQSWRCTEWNHVTTCATSAGGAETLGGGAYPPPPLHMLSLMGIWVCSYGVRQVSHMSRREWSGRGSAVEGFVAGGMQRGGGRCGLHFPAFSAFFPCIWVGPLVQCSRGNILVALCTPIKGLSCSQLVVRNNGFRGRRRFCFRHMCMHVCLYAHVSIFKILRILSRIQK